MAESLTSPPQRADLPQRDRRQVFRDLTDTLRLSTHVLERLPDQLELQLLARLPSETFEVLHDAPVRHGSWLRLDSATLTPSGGPLLRTLAGSAGGGRVCAFSPDGRLILSGSGIWDAACGWRVAALE